MLLFLFVLVWAWFFVVFLRTIPSTAAIRDFYVEELKISHERLQTIRWDRVIAVTPEHIAEVAPELKPFGARFALLEPRKPS